MEKSWSSFEKWSMVLTVAAIVVGVVIGIFVPEFRVWLGLEKRPETPSIPMPKPAPQPIPYEQVAPTPNASKAPQRPEVSQTGQNNIAQIGGHDNQAVINAAPSSRVLTPANAEKFRTAISAFPSGAFGVVTASTSDDVLPLKQQLEDMVRTANWSVSSVGEFHTSAGPPVADGLECYLRGGWDTPMGRAFQTAMNSAGLKCQYFPTSYSRGGVTLYDGAVTVVIGRNTGEPRNKN